jgi:hypothetical protein
VSLEIARYEVFRGLLSQIATLCGAIDRFCKALKTKTFISQKSLDTPVFRLIRFLQKVLTALPPLELFSLEEEAAQLPGGFFVLHLFAVALARLRGK